MLGGGHRLITAVAVATPVQIAGSLEEHDTSKPACPCDAAHDEVRGQVHFFGFYEPKIEVATKDIAARASKGKAVLRDLIDDPRVVFDISECQACGRVTIPTPGDGRPLLRLVPDTIEDAKQRLALIAPMPLGAS